MASAFGHAVAAFAIGKSIATKKQSLKFWITGIVCSILPDADVLSFAFGIPYLDMWGHRGITHSIFFALILAILLSFTLFKRKKINYLSLVISSLLQCLMECWMQ